ncbi:MAG: zinc-binding dehydrogenase, partial [Boseongicola sp.]|nr:zinc-binding dehydrogenase [Boseongicola sp.]
RNAEVIAVTSLAKSDSLLKLGAHQTVNRNDDLVETLGENSVDVVLDLVAGPKWPGLLDVLRPHGRYAVAGAVAGPIVELDVRTLYLKDLSFFGCTALDTQVFGNLVNLIETGKIKPLVAATFDLEDITTAQEVFADKGYTGKIVLKVARP